MGWIFENWEAMDGMNCNPGSQASSANPTVLGLTLIQCKALCEATSDCNMIVMVANEDDASKGACFLRNMTDLSQCSPMGNYQSYVLNDCPYRGQGVLGTDQDPDSPL